MHDLFCSGVCTLVVKLVLHDYVLIQRLFNCTYLNAVINLFNYVYTDRKNKPSANFTPASLSRSEYSLSQKAAQMWCLIRALPFLLSEKVPEGDKHMKLVIYLLRIMEIILAPKISRSLLPYLKCLIDDFFHHLKDLFPNFDWINKLHHLRHYAEVIEWSGPINQFNCFRFEGKFGEIKLRAQNVHNFKNPPKTLIRISQCTQALKWSNDNVKINRFEIISSKDTSVDSTLSRTHLSNEFFHDEDQIIIAKSVALNGVEFKKYLFVVLETATEGDDDLLLFGRIEEIIVLEENNAFFLTSVCTTNYFDSDLHAYSISLNSVNDFSRFAEASTLPYYKPLSFWTKVAPGSKELYISLRHFIL